MSKSKKIYVPTMEICFDKDNRIESIEVVGQVYTRARRIEECEPTETYCCPCGQDLISNNVGIANGGAIELDPPELYNYCPNCGAKVRKPEQPVDNAQADSREKLEADAVSILRNAASHTSINTSIGDMLRYTVPGSGSAPWQLEDDACEALASIIESQLAELTAERDELQSIIDHMPKTEQECEACQEAHDRLMFNAKVDMDKLRDELKRKQLVIDRQRDSFLKLEAENAELRRMLADAAEAI